MTSRSCRAVTGPLISYYAPRIPLQYMSAITAGWLYVGWGAPLFETNYGLMQHSPSEIKERLLKALDKEYNVVDMAAVLEVVSILERTPITKEALETTRLGRDINELRRKTKNESLAKRAKELVKRWRDLILGSEEGCTTAQQNGGGRKERRPVVSPATSTANSSGRSSPMLMEAVPRTHASNKRLRKDEDSSTINGDCQLVSVTKRDIVKEKIASIARVAKVKTTQELVAGLGSGGGGAADSLAKTEHIARFLRSEPTDRVTIVDIDDDDDDEEKPQSTEVPTPLPSQSPQPPSQEEEKKAGRRTPVEEILARLPPLDPEAIDWSEPPYLPPPPLDPEAVLSSNVDCITGNESAEGFREWHEILSRPYQSGDVIHILPYVVID